MCKLWRKLWHKLWRRPWRKPLRKLWHWRKLCAHAAARGLAGARGSPALVDLGSFALDDVVPDAEAGAGAALPAGF